MVREFDVLMSRMLGESIGVDFVLDPTAGACNVDPAQFGSALLNLAIDSRDAMPSGGHLTVRTGTGVLDRRAAARHAGGQPGEYVMVEIGDDGAGMPPEVLERAAEPFFTTKEVGLRTGLGLSQVHGFVRQSGGFMTLQSTPGSGTVARLHFPRVVANAYASSSVPAPEPSTGPVLVVEDDPDVLDLLCMLLADLGYTVLAATNGPEALDVLQRPEHRVDVLLTDMVMPGGMTGVELIRAVRALRPELPAVLTSGYLAGNIGQASGVDDSFERGVPTLTKPYQQEELAAVIAQAVRRG
jgi:CheY-like chemotaxis protein